MSCKTCFDNRLLAMLSTASCARLVPIKAMRAPAANLHAFWSEKDSRLASVGLPPLADCHSLLLGCLTVARAAGGGGRIVDLSAELGKTGGHTGGGGLLEDELASA